MNTSPVQLQEVCFNAYNSCALASWLFCMFLQEGIGMLVLWTSTFHYPAYTYVSCCKMCSIHQDFPRCMSQAANKSSKVENLQPDPHKSPRGSLLQYLRHRQGNFQETDTCNSIICAIYFVMHLVNATSGTSSRNPLWIVCPGQPQKRAVQQRRHGLTEINSATASYDHNSLIEIQCCLGLNALQWTGSSSE